MGDSGSFPGLGRSPGEGIGNPLQYSCLENSMDGWRSQLDYSPRCRKESDMTERLHFHFTSTEIQSREGGYTPASTHLKPEFFSGHLQLRDV